MPKTRLDLLLVARGLAASREKAQAMILAGLVEVDGRRVDKAGTAIAKDAKILVAGPEHPYVSRGGVKLAAALDAFAIEPAGLVCLDVGASTGGFTDCLLQRGAARVYAIDPAGLVCLDVGASTGGFTDCLLQRGAARVYAIDVGYGQLDAKLRNDPRVVLREKINARSLSFEHVPEPAALAVIDLSFISVRLVLPALLPLLAPGARIVVLVKPQFEAGRAEVGKGGVVRSEAVRARVLRDIQDFALGLGLAALGSIRSPIRGARGNQELLLGLTAP